MKINVQRYNKEELLTAIAELEKRGFKQSSQIVCESHNGKHFTHDWKIPEFYHNYMSVKYRVQMKKEELMS